MCAVLPPHVLSVLFFLPSVLVFFVSFFLLFPFPLLAVWFLVSLAYLFLFYLLLFFGHLPKNLAPSLSVFASVVHFLYFFLSPAEKKSAKPRVGTLHMAEEAPCTGLAGGLERSVHAMENGRAGNTPGVQEVLKYVAGLDVEQVGVFLAQISDVSTLKGLRSCVRALEDCVQERIDVLKARREKDIPNDAENLVEAGLDLRLDLSAQPHAPVPRNKWAGDRGCTVPSSSGTAAAGSAVSGTTTTMRQAFMHSEGLRTTTATTSKAFTHSGDLKTDIQNLAHLPQKTAAARHAHNQVSPTK